MKTKIKASKALEQPKPFTPGVTRGMVREHAYRLYRDKLPEHPLTLEDWVLAEKDLVATMEAGRRKAEITLSRHARADKDGQTSDPQGVRYNQALGRNFFHSQPSGS